MRLAFFLVVAAAGTACDGVIGRAPRDEAEQPKPTRPRGPDFSACDPVSKNDEVRLALAAGCAGCHTVGNRPFFRTLAAFENGLVYDERFVRRGDPEGSLLVQFLRGTAEGTYNQMPPNETYEELLVDGRATLSVEAIEDWIRDLPPAPARLDGPQPDLFSVRRVTAEEMVQGLMDQLGLTVADFVYRNAGWETRPYEVPPGRFFVWSADWAPGLWQGYGLDVRATERFQALGGPIVLTYRKRDNAFGPSAAQSLVQMSQAWCQYAVELGRREVLGDVTLAHKSATDADAIKRNIRRLHLRMLGEPASEEDLEELFTALFVPYEATSTTAAWTAVCASFVRHPLWLTY